MEILQLDTVSEYTHYNITMFTYLTGEIQSPRVSVTVNEIGQLICH